MGSFSCVVIGEGSLTMTCAEMVLTRGNTITAIATHNAFVRAWAEGKGLKVVTPGPDLVAKLQPGFDWLLSIANLWVVPQSVLDLPSKGAINIHDGPLPRHAGVNATLWALLEGETTHAVSWHLIEGGVDEGDVLACQPHDITPEDTGATLLDKTYETAKLGFVSVLDQLESDVLQRTRQDLSQRSYHALAKRPRGYGMLDFAQPATDLARLIRGLDHGTAWNPLCVPKLQTPQGLVFVSQGRLIESHAAPGTVLSVTQDSISVACAEQAIELQGLTWPSGDDVDAQSLVHVGDILHLPTADEIAQIDASIGQVAVFDARARLAFSNYNPVRLPDLGTSEGAIDRCSLSIPDGAEGLACVMLWAQRLCGQDNLHLAWSDEDLTKVAQTGMVAPWSALPVGPGGLDQQRQAAVAALSPHGAPKGVPLDLFARDPDLDWPDTPDIAVSFQAGHVPGTAVTLCLDAQPSLSYDSGRVSAAQAALWAARLDLVATAPDARMSTFERDMVLNRWNESTSTHDRDLTMQTAFEAQVARTPDAPALVFEDQTLTYAQLNARANQAAHVLRDMGVTQGKIVGLCCRRSVDLLVGALAILKAGGAYLPMDPSYPADRLRHFVEDSGADILVTQAGVEPHLPPHKADLLVLDAEPQLDQASADNPPVAATPQDLAYLIYTSGSTGKPKGVMIEHRNVVNFYAGMDAHIPHDPAGTWLAVTSLSFDISVLELFWTTARGFKVVLTSDEDRGLISKGPMPRSDKGMQYSIYYWGNDDGVGRDKYNLLLEGAKFADENGFVAVWTPERHFHAFGGPYPNPSVTGAAVAGMTKNIGVRAGSVVAPLHHPARIAEEWSVIDNLTNGRAGLAFASGWQPDDFILRPENTPPENKPALLRDIDTVRKLWRGEAVGFPRKDGQMHEVVTQPRPVSSELPVWVTTAGNPKTWEEAGTLGCNVLTHLLGQSIDEVGEKIKLYHAALRAAGHDPRDFTVTLMLHTFLSDSREHAREIAREPMKDYLRSAAGLIKQYAWAFPAFKRPDGVKNAFDLQLDGLNEDELEAILDFAFERYFNDSGLFGTIEDAQQRSADLQAIGVTEIACLIDYGITRETVLEGLRPLAQVVQSMLAPPELATDDFSIAAQIVRHDVTHLQCTPSMARMIAMNDEARFALKQVKHLYLGGEPLPGALVQDFAQITDATLTNMYGPTETTIWSSVEQAQGTDSIVNIGHPLVNQRLYVLDEDRAPVAIGEDGELWIGGDGVTRGYWNRPDLTAERFVDNPFHSGRMYRTGDLVRRRADGRIDFVGRVDHQIKLRGFRIELGEIEAALEAQTGVTQAVVTAREDVPGDVRLVGYYTGDRLDPSTLKAGLSQDLPSFMVPGRFVRLEAFPLTPNKKVDRNALPAPQVASAKPAPKPVERAAAVPAAAQPGDTREVEAALGRIWADVLGVAAGPRDNFFDLGGHSLLAVQAHRAIRQTLGAQALSITDIFRYPVLSDLATRIAGLGVAPVVAKAAPTQKSEQQTAPVAAPAPVVSGRAQSRTDAMARRREMRARRRA